MGEPVIERPRILFVDNIAVEAAKRTFDAVGSKRRELRVFGKTHGHADHYGHFDLLMGHRAKDEVFTLIDRWLDEHDAG